MPKFPKFNPLIDDIGLYISLARVHRIVIFLLRQTGGGFATWWIIAVPSKVTKGVCGDRVVGFVGPNKVKRLCCYPSIIIFNWI